MKDVIISFWEHVAFGAMQIDLPFQRSGIYNQNTK